MARLPSRSCWRAKSVGLQPRDLLAISTWTLPRSWKGPTWMRWSCATSIAWRASSGAAWASRAPACWAGPAADGVGERRLMSMLVTAWTRWMLGVDHLSEAVALFPASAARRAWVACHTICASFTSIAAYTEATVLPAAGRGAGGRSTPMVDMRVWLWLGTEGGGTRRGGDGKEASISSRVVGLTLASYADTRSVVVFTASCGLGERSADGSESRALSSGSVWLSVSTVEV